MPKAIEGIYAFDGGWFWVDENQQLRGDPSRGCAGFLTQQDAIEEMNKAKEEVSEE